MHMHTATQTPPRHACTSAPTQYDLDLPRLLRAAAELRLPAEPGVRLVYVHEGRREGGLVRGAERVTHGEDRGLHGAQPQRLKQVAQGGQPLEGVAGYERTTCMMAGGDGEGLWGSRALQDERHGNTNNNNKNNKIIIRLPYFGIAIPHK